MHKKLWQITILQQAKSYLKRLPRAECKRFLDALEGLMIDPTRGSKPLEGRPERSLRVGEIRVLLMLNPERREVVVTRIGPWGDIYKSRR